MENIKRKKWGGDVLQWHIMMMELLNVMWERIIQIWVVPIHKKCITKRKVSLMTDQENGNAAENVIQGPWPKSKRKVKVPDESVIELQEKIGFAEELCQSVIVQMIHTMGENGIDVTEKDFIRDMGLIIEFTKGTIYRGMELPHQTQPFLEHLVETTTAPDNSVESEVNMDLIENYIKMLGEDDDDPEVS